MLRPNSRRVPLRSRKGCSFSLAFFWLAGLLSGITAACRVWEPLTALMRRMNEHSVSIVGAVCATLLPVLISFVVSSAPALILAICGCKGFLFTFVSLGILQCFGEAGWLIRWLLMFADLAVMPVLYGYWLRAVSAPPSRWHGVALLSWAILILVIEIRVIVPFTAGVINFWKG